MGGALAQYEGIKAFSETDQTEDLKAIKVPTLVTKETMIRSCRMPPPARSRQS